MDGWESDDDLDLSDVDFDAEDNDNDNDDNINSQASSNNQNSNKEQNDGVNNNNTPEKNDSTENNNNNVGGTSSIGIHTNNRSEDMAVHPSRSMSPTHFKDSMEDHNTDDDHNDYNDMMGDEDNDNDGWDDDLEFDDALDDHHDYDDGNNEEDKGNKTPNQLVSPQAPLSPQIVQPTTPPSASSPDVKQEITLGEESTALSHPPLPTLSPPSEEQIASLSNDNDNIWRDGNENNDANGWESDDDLQLDDSFDHGGLTKDEPKPAPNYDNEEAAAVQFFDSSPDVMEEETQDQNNGWGHDDDDVDLELDTSFDQGDDSAAAGITVNQRIVVDEDKYENLDTDEVDGIGNHTLPTVVTPVESTKVVPDEGNGVVEMNDVKKGKDDDGAEEFNVGTDETKEVEAKEVEAKEVETKEEDTMKQDSSEIDSMEDVGLEDVGLEDGDDAEEEEEDDLDGAAEREVIQEEEEDAKEEEDVKDEEEVKEVTPLVHESSLNGGIVTPDSNLSTSIATSLSSDQPEPTEQVVLAPSRLSEEEDDVLHQLNNHVHPLSIPMNQAEGCAINVDEMLHEESNPEEELVPLSPSIPLKKTTDLDQSAVTGIEMPISQETLDDKKPFQDTPTDSKKDSQSVSPKTTTNSQHVSFSPQPLPQAKPLSASDMRPSRTMSHHLPASSQRSLLSSSHAASSHSPSKIDYPKLLQIEIAKSLIMEKEIAVLKTTIDDLEFTADTAEQFQIQKNQYMRLAEKREVAVQHLQNQVQEERMMREKGTIQLQGEIFSLTSILEDKKEEMVRMEANIQKLEKERKDQEEELNIMERAVEKGHKSMLENDEVMKDMEERLMQMEEEVKVSNTAKDMEIAKAKDLQHQLDNSQAKMDELTNHQNNQVAELQAQLQTALHSQKALEEQHQTLVRTTHEKELDLTNQLSQSQDKYNALVTTMETQEFDASLKIEDMEKKYNSLLTTSHKKESESALEHQQLTTELRESKTREEEALMSITSLKQELNEAKEESIQNKEQLLLTTNKNSTSEIDSEKLEELQHKLEEAEFALELQTETEQDLKMEIAAKNDEHESMVMELTAKIEDTNTKYRMLQQDFDKKENTQIVDLREKLMESQQSKQDMETRANTLEKELETTNDKLDHMQQDYLDLENKHATTQEELTKSISSLEQHLSSLKTQLSTTNLQRDENEQILSNLQNEMQIQKTAAEECIAKWEEQYQALQNENESLHEELTHLNDKVMSVQKEKDDLALKFQSMVEQKQNLTNKVSTNQIMVDQLQEQLAQTISEHEVTTSSLQSDKQELLDDNEELLVQLGLYTQTQKELKHDFTLRDEEYQVLIQKYEDQLSELNGKFNQVEKEKDEALNEKQELVNQIEDLQQNVQANDCDNQIEILKQEKMDLIERISHHVKNEIQMKALNTDLTHRCKEIAEMDSDFHERLETVRIEKEELIEKISVLMAEKSALGSLVFTLQESVKDLNAQIDELQTTATTRAEAASEKPASGMNGWGDEDLNFDSFDEDNQPQSQPNNSDLQSQLEEANTNITNQALQIKSLQTELATSKQTLASKTHEIGVLEANLLSLQLDHDAKGKDEMTLQENEERIVLLTEALGRKDEDKLEVEKRVSSLEKELRDSIRLLEGADKKIVGQENTMDKSVLVKLAQKEKELIDCKSLVSSLETELITKQQELLSIKEEQIQTASLSKHKQDLSESFSKTLSLKEEELLESKSQLESTKRTLSTTKTLLTQKEQETYKLLSQLQEYTSRPQNLHDLEISKTDAESVEFMRKKIISVAAALDKSEMERAKALERLSDERRVHAESLRKVSENVKRFYSALNAGRSSP